MHVARETAEVLRGEQPTVSPERSSPISAASNSVDRMLSVSALVEQCRREIQAYRRGELSNETYGLELLRRAVAEGDQDAWAGLQQCMSELVRSWLYAHPRQEAALRWQSEEDYVALAFGRFWQTTLQRQVVYKTLTEVLVSLRASLNGAILETLRISSRPGEVLRPETGEPHMQDSPGSRETWDTLQTLLPGQREQRLAYLLFHCGLDPREIVRCYPQEWSDVQEIYHLRCHLLNRLLHHDELTERAAQSEEEKR